ncbi:ISAs1 family transposase [Streptomyces cacaoi]
MPSSLIGVLQRHCTDTDSTCPEPSQPTCLAGALGRIPDPRRGRDRRYRLGSLLALWIVAVLGGATSLAAIARFAADTDSDLREQLGLTSSTPNASTLGRLLARLDGDDLDDAVGAWLARYAADVVDEPGDTLVGLAVNGQTVRGSRSDGAAVHLLAAALHACQTVIAQRQIAAKSNEIPAFAPLLNRIALRGAVVTADAMHTQRAHAEHVITAGGHYLLVVKGNHEAGLPPLFPAGVGTTTAMDPQHRCDLAADMGWETVLTWSAQGIDRFDVVVLPDGPVRDRAISVSLLPPPADGCCSTSATPSSR